MTTWLAAALAGCAAATLLAVPAPGRLRLGSVSATPTRGRRPRAVPLVLTGPAALIGLALGGPVLAALVPVGLLAAVRLRLRRRHGTEVVAERAAATQACAVLSAELAAGRTPAEALAAAGDVARGAVRRALRSAASAARLGGDVPAALVAPAEGRPAAGALHSLAACWSVCAQSGAGLAAAVQRIEQGLRAQAAQQRRVDAELAGPRATAALLAVLPGAGLLLAAGVGADPLHVLLETRFGVVCLLLGLALDGLGLLWTDRLVRRVRPP